MDSTALGKRLNQARKDAGLTSERLSELCSINATYLRQIESGKKTPSLPVFINLCRVLKVSPAYLLAEEFQGEEDSGMDSLFELWQTATPRQLKLITAMIRSALDNL